MTITTTTPATIISLPGQGRINLYQVIQKPYSIKIIRLNHISGTSKRHHWMESRVTSRKPSSGSSLCTFLSIQSGHFHGNLWAKGDHLMETSYLKAHPLEGRYPEWTPNFHSDRSQYSNLCARGSQGPQRASGSTYPREDVPNIISYNLTAKQ